QGEQEHKQAKKLYGRTNKRKDFVSQVAVHYRREQLLRRIGMKSRAATKAVEGNGRRKGGDQERETSPCIPSDDRNALPLMHPQEHHHISSSDKARKNIIRFIHANSTDPAVRVGFSSGLKDHILCRLLSLETDCTFSEDERDQLQIVGNHIYQHGTLRVNYTTYDMR
ncbi:hypothetical protein CPB84DRAFT_1630486, partial [Gymnopilus junonius]